MYLNILNISTESRILLRHLEMTNTICTSNLSTIMIIDIKILVHQSTDNNAYAQNNSLLLKGTYISLYKAANEMK